jgi:hypothetical protein
MIHCIITLISLYFTVILWVYGIAFAIDIVKLLFCAATGRDYH